MGELDFAVDQEAVTKTFVVAVFAGVAVLPLDLDHRVLGYRHFALDVLCFLEGTPSRELSYEGLRPAIVCHRHPQLQRQKA